MKKTVRGEMVVFLSLTIMLVASLLFTLVEGAHYRCLKSFSEMDSILETNSAFADYDKAMLKEYGLLFLDDSYGSGKENTGRVVSRIKSLAEENVNPDTMSGVTLLRLHLKECGIDGYELATDDNGSAFRRQVIEYTKESFGIDALSELSEALTKGSTDTGNYSRSCITNAESSMASAAAARDAKAQAEGEEAPAPAAPALDFENPFDLFNLLQGKAVLSITKPKDREISVKSVDLSDVTAKRHNNKGNWSGKKPSAMDDLWFMLYLRSNFGNFNHVRDQKKLDYEQEFILCGYKSDKKNLESTCGQIIPIREAANFAYLMTDGEKMGIAEAIAAAIAIILLSPELVEPIKYGILGAWAYVESLQDMRTLLAGGRVPMIKTAATWVTDVWHPATSFASSYGGKSDSGGLSYEDYLFLLLFMLGKKDQNYRTMSMMELNLRQLPGKEHFRMDCCIQRMKVGYGYQGNPLFLSFVTIGDPDRSAYRFEWEQSISYLSGDG